MTTAGSYRSRAPAETLALITPHLPALGITRVGSQTGLDRIGIPVWFAVTPNARAIAIAQGKGLTDEDAQASAVMEAVERVIASSPSCVRRSASRRDIEADGESVDLLETLLSPWADPVAPDEVIDWTPAENLLSGHTAHLPFDAVHLDRTQLKPRYWRSSDGLASGNTWDEAVLHGLLERVERDALTLWHVTPPTRRPPAIDPACLATPTIDDLVQRIERAGLIIRLFDISSDLNLPCFMALIAPAAVLAGGAVRHVDLTLGSGAHFTAAGAAARAITEAAQSRLTFIGGARDDVPAAFFTDPAPEDLCKVLRAPVDPLHRPGSTGALPEPNERLPLLLARLASAGLSEAYALRLDDGRLPIAVGKLIVPGLENPPGAQRQRFGPRALRRVLG